MPGQLRRTRPPRCFPVVKARGTYSAAPDGAVRPPGPDSARRVVALPRSPGRGYLAPKLGGGAGAFRSELPRAG
ncbi:hypothetical protein SZN_19220 [Streptomyces zinciresistens K42]|uniref:Uncharacterized protein n=1 Tax=Streptomyces zinciresistens K42 TaxID=700597 RepID=G2GEB3_9ACTN|nr:hypothetical protein SZN_19220 [Streptomyces zinciresistens K42]